jgi:8-amino-3,8-dideoxy-alpha-D-manno-octulosonate transaminase
MDPNDLIKKISKKTKAIILVHMLGSPGRINEILKICKKNKIVVIEDTAWGLGATYKKKYLGTIGRIGTFSFDYAKMITTGEGGMLLFKSKKDFLKAKAWHDHGHDNNPKFPRWQDTRSSSGFNFRMSELQAAVGLAQLKKLDQILKLHKINSSKILNRIKNISEIKIRYIPSKSSPSNDAVIFILPNKRLAKICKINLNKNKISTKILPEAKTWHFCKHWAHMHELEKANKKKLYYSFPKSENILSRCISIPINCKMSKSLPNIIYSIVNKTLLNEK